MGQDSASRQTPRTRAEVWGFLVVVGLGLATLRLEASLLLYGILGIGAGLWLVYSLRFPLASFAVMLYIWALAYTRLSVQVMGIEELGGRGSMSLGDLLWLSFVAAMLLRALAVGEAPRAAIPAQLGSIVLYVLVSACLPIAGLLGGDWPLTYAVPGLRHLQWASFGVISFMLARRYGSTKVFRRILVVEIVAAACHFLYAVMQTAYHFGYIPYSLLWLDRLFVERNGSSWFFYPRTTGLLVNPNSYGLFGAMILVLGISTWITKHQVPRSTALLSVLVSLWALASSGSRSAMVGATLGVLLMLGVVMATRRPHSQMRQRLLGLVGILIGLGTVVFSLVPSKLSERVARLGDVLIHGVQADPNASARASMWRAVLSQHFQEYPLGTLVPPSYALQHAIDSYYVFTWAQGTLLYMAIYIAALIGCARFGLALVRKQGSASAVGLALLGSTGVVAGASLTLSPLLQSPVNSLFWSLVGVAWYTYVAGRQVRVESRQAGRCLEDVRS